MIAQNAKRQSGQGSVLFLPFFRKSRRFSLTLVLKIRIIGWSALRSVGRIIFAHQL